MVFTDFGRHNKGITRFVPFALLTTALSVQARAFLVIDDFTDGEYRRVFNQRGTYQDTITGIDPSHTAGGSRDYIFRLLSNPDGYDLTMDIGNHRLDMSWMGRIPQEIELAYGTFMPMQLNLSWLTSFEISRRSTPSGINGTGYRMFLFDTHGQDTYNFDWRQRQDEGIGFNRQDFANPSFDWSSVRIVVLRQTYDFPNSAIRGYQTTQILAVPEPMAWPLLGGAFAMARLRRRARRQVH